MAISVKKAKAAVLKNTKPLGAEKIPLSEGLGRELVGELRSSYDYPLRDVSAMDGFAYRFRDLRPGKPLLLSGERAAGDLPGKALKRGGAVRIMTGAPLPPGADTVTTQERSMVEGGLVFFYEETVRGQHVRKKGEGTRKGKRIHVRREPLCSRSLGFLASLGVGSLKVRRRPRVRVLVTGEELVPPGKQPGGGGVFESNGLMLSSALREEGAEADVQRAGDKEGPLVQRVKAALGHCDILLVTGGVSVGEHDPTRGAFRAAGVRKIFWKVAQKPGGPLYFGRWGRQAVFGLPGNPAAVYSCFLLYVLPLLRKLQGLPAPGSFPVRLQHEIKPLGKKTLFAKASLNMKKGRPLARVLRDQGSHLLEGLALGDGLLEIPPGKELMKKSTVLSFHPFREDRYAR